VRGQRRARPTIAGGLLVAFPLIFAFLLGTRPPADARWRLQAVALFGFAVLLLQYEDVGGLEWGWRYFAVALVPVCAQIGVAADAGWQRHRGAGRTALALVVIGSFLVVVGGLREQRRFLGNTAAFERAAGDLLDEPADWIVSADASFGRFAYGLSLEREVLTLPGDGTPDVLGELGSSGADRVLLVWRDDRPDLDLGPFVLVGSPSDIASGYRWQPLRREDR